MHRSDWTETSMLKVAAGAVAGGGLTYALASEVFSQAGSDQPSPGSGSSPGSDTSTAPTPPTPSPDSGTGSGSMTTTPRPPPDFDAAVALSGAAGETIEINDTAPAESASSVHLTLDDLK